MFQDKSFRFCLFLVTVLLAAACAGPAEQPQQPAVVTRLKDVPSVRLNYRYEPDVPPPDLPNRAADERSPAVQTDFDQNRLNELLDRTVISPDGKRILAVYHLPTDMQSEFRLDMYSAEGVLLKKITADAMAAHFPDTIVWSPDSSTVAFVATTRTMSNASPTPTPLSGDILQPPVELNANGDPEASPEATATPAPSSTPAAPSNILTFRTEQIYICNPDGDGVKPITQNEGLIYFYYVWSPDSSMLAALAATGREWQYLELQANDRKEQFVPVGRPRVIEKNGRERRLDDGLTAVQPVWSADSAKVACAFEHQVRVYDSRGDTPTQAAIPMRNNLLISSQAYDREQQSKLNAAPDANQNANTNTNSKANSNGNATPAPDLPPTALPDPNTLVSFNPIIALVWPTDDQLYFQTAYVKRMKNDADSVMSFPRWHRLILTPQPSVLGRP